MKLGDLIQNGGSLEPSRLARVDLNRFRPQFVRLRVVLSANLDLRPHPNVFWVIGSVLIVVVGGEFDGYGLVGHDSVIVDVKGCGAMDGGNIAVNLLFLGGRRTGKEGHQQRERQSLRAPGRRWYGGSHILLQR